MRLKLIKEPNCRKILMLQTLRTIFLSKKKLTHDVYEFVFLCNEPSRFYFERGQYLILMVPKDNDKINRLYSIFDFEESKNSFKIILKIIPGGVGSEYLVNLKQGERVEFQGPAGIFTINKNTKDKIFIATGIGIAPILSMIKESVNKTNSKFSLFWGLKTKSDIFYLDLLSQIAEKYKNFTFEIFISREDIKDKSIIISNGHVNIGIDKMLIDSNINKENLEFYLCGSIANVDSLRNYLISKEIKPEDIKTERFK